MRAVHVIHSRRWRLSDGFVDHPAHAQPVQMLGLPECRVEWMLSAGHRCTVRGSQTRSSVLTGLAVDKRLVAWGRAVSARRHNGLPPLWLFTDSRRMADPLAAAARLPRGLAGIVFRHDDHPERLRLGRKLARICRLRRLVLVVAGDVRMARGLGAGVHLRSGLWPGPIRLPQDFPVTSSAHSAADLHRAARAGAGLVFLSPAFPTASHPGAPALGPIRWSRLARQSRIPVAALGGVDGAKVRRFPRRQCHAVGAIGALG